MNVLHHRDDHRVTVRGNVLHHRGDHGVTVWENVLHHRGDHRVRVRENVLHLGVTMGSGCASHVVATGGFGLPSSCGPSLARIEFDNWGFLWRCLFAEK